MKSEFLIVAKKVMEIKLKPMSARELFDVAQKMELFSDNIVGKTPHQTMKSKLSVHIRRFGEVSIFVRTSPGLFYLRELLDGSKPVFNSKPIRPPRSEERVLAYKTSELDEIMNWQGVQTRWKRIARKVFNLKPYYLPRFDVEQNSNYTQVVTYILVSRKNALLAYRRGSYNRVERFLQGADCIGFGGHVIQTDLNLFSSQSMGVFECAARELSEELRLPKVDINRIGIYQGLNIVGIINDDSSYVGRRHLAFVMRYEVSEDQYWESPVRGEKGITQLRWISSTASNRVWLWNFEYWSQLCLREYEPQLVKVQPAYRLIRKSPLKPPNILILIGPVGSGKSLARGVLCMDYGYTEINSGEIMAELMDVPPIPLTSRENFQEKALKYITQPSSPKVLAERLMELARTHRNPRILIDGVRHRSTLQYLMSMNEGRAIGVIYVQTPPDQAYKFYVDRFNEGTAIDDFLAIRDAPVESEVEGLILFADAVLYNWTGKLEYRAAIRSMMQQLGIREET